MRLGWTPSNHSGIDKLVVPSDMVWFPRVHLVNTNIDGEETPARPAWFRLQSTGMVTSLSISQLSSSCYLDMHYFPLDRQTCFLSFASTMYDSREVRLNVNTNISVEEVVHFSNHEWKVTDITNEVRSSNNSIVLGFDTFARYRLELQRVPTYYIMNIVIPSGMIFALSFCVFWLPPDCGERLSLSSTFLITLSVFHLLIGDVLPTNSNYSRLSVLLLLDMGMVSLTILVSVAMINIQRNAASNRPVSPWIRKLFLTRDWLPWRRTLLRQGEDRKNTQGEGVATSTGWFQNSTCMALNATKNTDGPRDMQGIGEVERPSVDKVKESGAGEFKITSNRDDQRKYAQQDAETIVDHRGEWDRLVKILDRSIFVTYVIITVAAGTSWMNGFTGF
ncbi:neuronal acetylcholine receptor subunit non-alpha-2-like [Ptychodera flava]|uniref:neuronal acetylcholine receptor subunit non-alpha-2-like n=1 Tax=Ptychodera flava TaxID=63121 RepID=UPI00396A8A4F